MARIGSGKSSRNNDSEGPRERDKSPVFTNKNLKEAITKSKIQKHYRE